jgi:ankyrin repeat protein
MTLLNYVKSNNVLKLKHLLDLGFNVNKKDKKGNSLIFIACALSNEKVIKLLLNYNVKFDLNHNGETVFDYIYKNKKLTLLLINRGFNPHICNVRGDMLIHNLARSNYILECCIKDCNIKNKNGNSSFHIACKYGNLGFIKNLISLYDGSKNHKGENLLHISVINNNIELTKYLLNIINCNEKDARGLTPFHHALINKNISMAKLLFGKSDLSIIYNSLDYIDIFYNEKYKNIFISRNHKEKSFCKWMNS